MATSLDTSPASSQYDGDVKLLITTLSGDNIAVSGCRTWPLEELSAAVARALDLRPGSFELLLGTEVLRDQGPLYEPLAATVEPTVSLSLVQTAAKTLNPVQHLAQPNFRKDHWTPADGYGDSYMMMGAVGGAHCGSVAGKPVGYALGAVGGALAAPVTGGDWRMTAESSGQMAGGMLGAVAAVTGGLAGGVIQGVVTGAKATANEVDVTAHLGRIQDPERDSYCFGDFTKGIAAKGRLSRGGDVEGYRFGDFTRGLFTASNNKAVRDGLQAEQATRAEAAHDAQAL